MLFCSSRFLQFFALVGALYWLLPWKRARVYLLLAASFWFYRELCLELADARLAWIVLGMACIDYVVGLALEATSSKRGRQLLLVTSICVNLGVLGYLKYANFFLKAVAQSADLFGLHIHTGTLHILMPIGISFYTFEAINYTVDVYRRKLPAERNLANFLLFILFFPHLVAGPIVRSRDFLTQVRRPKRWNWLRCQWGLSLLLSGAFKKLVVADRLALLVDPVFGEPGAFATGATWLAVAAYALQIYGDFSGYSDLAIGFAHLLGYRLGPNFNMPYLAVNISDFWRRWHISLSSWLRDYLFIPLGGSRGSRWQSARNLLITMTLGGLWHGANWTFIVWGMMHGLLLAGHREFRNWCDHRPRLSAFLASSAGTVLRVLATVGCDILLWIPFRARTFGDMATILERMFSIVPGRRADLPEISLLFLFLLLVIGHLFTLRVRWLQSLRRLPAFVQAGAYAAATTAILLLAPPAGKTFIYFQF